MPARGPQTREKDLLGQICRQLLLVHNAVGSMRAWRYSGNPVLCDWQAEGADRAVALKGLSSEGPEGPLGEAPGSESVPRSPHATTASQRQLKLICTNILISTYLW